MKPSLSLSPVLILIFFSFSLQAQADLWWRWSFGTEEGYFLTDGSMADTGSAHTFNILDFALTQSGQGIQAGTLSGKQFAESQTGQGFKWSGTGITEFFRLSGTYTNGSGFALADFSLDYSFGPNEGADGRNSRLRDPKTNDEFSSGPLTIAWLYFPRAARPDALVGKRPDSANHKGNDVYDESGAGQKLRIPVSDRKKAAFYFSADSDADVPEDLMIRASRGNRHFKVKYYARAGSAWKNQTGEITGSGLPMGRVVPGKPTLVRARIKPDTRGRRKTKTLVFETRSNEVPSLMDLAKAKIKCRP